MNGDAAVRGDVTALDDGVVGAAHHRHTDRHTGAHRRDGRIVRAGGKPGGHDDLAVLRYGRNQEGVAAVRILGALGFRLLDAGAVLHRQLRGAGRYAVALFRCKCRGDIFAGLRPGTACDGHRAMERRGGRTGIRLHRDGKRLDVDGKRDFCNSVKGLVFVAFLAGHGIGAVGVLLDGQFDFRGALLALGGNAVDIVLVILHRSCALSLPGFLQREGNLVLRVHLVLGNFNGNFGGVAFRLGKSRRGCDRFFADGRGDRDGRVAGVFAFRCLDVRHFEHVLAVVVFLDDDHAVGAVGFCIGSFQLGKRFSGRNRHVNRDRISRFARRLAGGHRNARRNLADADVERLRLKGHGHADDSAGFQAGQVVQFVFPVADQCGVLRSGHSRRRRRIRSGGRFFLCICILNREALGGYAGFHGEEVSVHAGGNLGHFAVTRLGDLDDVRLALHVGGIRGRRRLAGIIIRRGVRYDLLLEGNLHHDLGAVLGEHVPVLGGVAGILQDQLIILFGDFAVVDRRQLLLLGSAVGVDEGHIDLIHLLVAVGCNGEIDLVPVVPVRLAGDRAAGDRIDLHGVGVHFTEGRGDFGAFFFRRRVFRGCLLRHRLRRHAGAVRHGARHGGRFRRHVQAAARNQRAGAGVDDGIVGIQDHADGQRAGHLHARGAGGGCRGYGVPVRVRRRAGEFTLDCQLGAGLHVLRDRVIVTAVPVRFQRGVDGSSVRVVRVGPGIDNLKSSFL